MIDGKSRLIVALDLPERKSSLAAVEELSGCVGFFKIGLELFVREGAALVEEVHARGERVFLDLKLHDIPNTVAGAVRSACLLGVQFLTVHAAGGAAMLAAAHEAALAAKEPVQLLAVTVLTSLSEDDLPRIGIPFSPAEWTSKLAALAIECGIRGIVCSPREVSSLRQRYGGALKFVVPGIRPGGSALHDQARISTPAQAILSGADYIVVGRPILQAASPRAAAIEIAKEVSAALQPPPIGK